jgi:sulfur-oxidizing protein SoxY
MRPQQALTRRSTIAAAIAVGAASTPGVARGQGVAPGQGGAQGQGVAPGQAAADSWRSLAAQLFDNRAIADGSAVLAIEAPYRAEYAAMVPVSIRVLGADGDARRIERLTLVIDENPSPLAATFTLGANAGTRAVATRVRVDSYTNIHAVAAMADGQLYAVERFVKAAGGCSAPAAKQEADAIPLGTMRFRQFARDPGSDTREVQLMIRHPNYSGMQMNQVTRLYVPAHFVAGVRIWQGDALLLGVESGISIAENPEFRFDYHSNGATEFRAEVTDSEGRLFKQNWSAARA